MARPRHTLGDEHSEAIRPSLPSGGRPGRPRKDHRRVIDGALWIPHAGAPRRDPPRETCRPRQTVHERLNRRGEDGARGRLPEAPRVRLDEAGEIDRDPFGIVGGSARASRAAAGAPPTDGTPAEPAGHAPGRSRGGYGSKTHRGRAGKGLPTAAAVTAGRRRGSTQVEAAMGSVRAAVPVGRPRKSARDKGYSDRRARRCLRRSGIRAVIPAREGQGRAPALDKPTYRRRDVAERCMGWVKESRWLATRFEELAGAPRRWSSWRCLNSR